MLVCVSVYMCVHTRMRDREKESVYSGVFLVFTYDSLILLLRVYLNALFGFNLTCAAIDGGPPRRLPSSGGRPQRVAWMNPLISFRMHLNFNRELVARVILETLRSIPVPDTHHDLSRVLAIISRLGEDPGINFHSIFLFLISSLRKRS